MTEEANLRKKISELQSELKTKDNEITKYLDKIDHLEEEIMSLHELIPEKGSKKKGKKSKDSKLTLELEAKDREIRDLKDRMGFLRIDKIAAQKELEKIRINEKASSVIRVEDIRDKDKSPLNILVKDLQEKINKQDSLIKRLKSGNIPSEDFTERLQEKEDIIQSLNVKIAELNEKLKEGTSKEEKKSKEEIKKSLLEDLQDQLNKSKRQIEELNKKLIKYEKKGKPSDLEEIKNEELIDKINKLSEELKRKDIQIEALRKSDSFPPSSLETKTLDQVVEELQNKLTKAKNHITLLEKQLNQTQMQEGSSRDVSQKDIDGKLKIQREMAIFLQQQLDESNKALKTKKEELGTIKNEAIRIKNKYEDLQEQIKMKDQIINDLKLELDKLSFKSLTQVPSVSAVDPNLTLRINELKNIIEDLNKQNIQQRLEISQLRKST